MENSVTPSESLSVKQGASTALSARQAVDDLHRQIVQPQMNAVLLFCSSEYDLDILGRAVQERFTCPVIGCTTAGEISSMNGYTKGGLVGVSLCSKDLFIHRQVISPLDQFSMTDAEALAKRLHDGLRLAPSFSERNHFGVLLVDGISMLEEEVVASLHAVLKGIPLVGGSAGDGLNFQKTWIYDEGRFLSNAAVYTLFETTLPFTLFRIQHFEPTDMRLVITESDNATRTVHEINGLPAAQEYARAVGLTATELSPFVFAAHPVMLRIGDAYYVRSIQKMNDDGSLTFFCAIDTGLVLTIARGVGLIENLKKNLLATLDGIPQARLVLGFDCILRRLEMEQKDLIADANAILRDVPFIGFSTYGEQFNGIHVNQTLAGFALGGNG